MLDTLMGMARGKNVIFLDYISPRDGEGENN